MTLRLLEEPKLRLLAEKVSKGVMGFGKATLQAPMKVVEPLSPAFKQAKPYLPLLGEKYEGVITKARKRAFGVESFEEPMKKAPDWTMFGVPPLTPFLKEEAQFRKGLIGTTADIYTRPDVLLGAVARGVRPITQARGLARLEKATPFFEKSGVKFPQGWSARRKAVEILNRAQVDPKVGDVVQRIISPQYVYGGGPSTKQIAQLAKQFNIPVARLETAIKTGSYAGLPAQIVKTIEGLQPIILTKDIPKQGENLKWWEYFDRKSLKKSLRDMGEPDAIPITREEANKIQSSNLSFYQFPRGTSTDIVFRLNVRGAETSGVEGFYIRRGVARSDMTSPRPLTEKKLYDKILNEEINEKRQCKRFRVQRP